MNALTIDYSKAEKITDLDKTLIEGIRKQLEDGGKDAKTVYNTLKAAFAAFKDIFVYESAKPKGVTELFNEFIAKQEWQDRFTEAYQSVNSANAEIEAALAQVSNLATPKFEPIYSTGQDPKLVGVRYVGKIMKADNAETFEMVSGLLEGVEKAKLDLARVSNDAVHELWPGGMTKTTRDGQEIPEWKAIKVEQDDETGKWEAAGRVQAPVDPNKPKTVRIGGKGRALTITYGEELVYKGGNLNLAYSEAGRFCASRKLGPFAAKPDFGLKNGEKVIVATKWDEVGKPALVKSGLTVVEE